MQVEYSAASNKVVVNGEARGDCYIEIKISERDPKNSRGSVDSVTDNKTPPPDKETSISRSRLPSPRWRLDR